MKLIELLVQELPKRGGWPLGCLAISINGRRQVWPHSKIPNRYRPVLGVWTDDSFWSHTTAGFSRPIFNLDSCDKPQVALVTKTEYDEAIAKALGKTK